jgi:hypothetical protein
VTRTVLVHVGAPKTGTSFVQDVLFQHRDELASRGILYPADRFDEHFLAALDLMELPWGGLEKEAVGAWDRLAEKVRAWDGTVIVSHEILATASRPQVRRALESFGEDAEVHVVLSARDLVRQIPAEWQENVKHRRVIGYRDFLDQITDPSRQGRLASWFWGVQEVPDILDRWGGELPPERVHLVTVPKPGAPRTLLWERFAAVLGIDPAEFSPESNRANPSLGVPESALVRRINERVNHGVLVNHRYRELVRELLVHRSLSHRRDGARLTLPPDVRAWAVQLSEQWIEELARRGYDVHDGRVRNAILVALLGEDEIEQMIKKKKLPAPPMAIATAPTHDPQLDRVIAAEVTAELLTRIAGKRFAGTVGRRVPVVGGLIGAGTDGFATWQIGRYADRELLPRTRR